jgi:hypothetical protein
MLSNNASNKGSRKIVPENVMPVASTPTANTSPKVIHTASPSQSQIAYSLQQAQQSSHDTSQVPSPNTTHAALRLPSVDLLNNHHVSIQHNRNYTKNILSEFDDLDVSLTTDVVRYALQQTKNSSFSFGFRMKKVFGEHKTVKKENPVVEVHIF